MYTPLPEKSTPSVLRALALRAPAGEPGGLVEVGVCGGALLSTGAAGAGASVMGF